MKRKLNSYLIITLLLFASILVFTGCKKEEVLSTQKVAQPAVQSKTAVESPVPVQKQLSTAKQVAPAVASFDFKTKKDPFKPLITPPEPAAAKPIPSKARSIDLLPIQSYDVSKFAVSGIITGFKENKALLIDPTGKGYVVRQGMLIGNGGGRISKITQSTVEVLEQLRDDHGHVKKRKIVLPLAKKK